MAMPLWVRALRLSGAARLLRSPRVQNLHTSPALASKAPVSTATGHGHHDHEDDMTDSYTRNPDWHGFSEDPEADVQNMRTVMFCGFSLCLVLGSVFVYYLPPRKMKHWARREAELQIKKREALGLPLIDMNYCDPASLVLPPLEEDE
ncbi:NADH dehydrogenase [ubiquinone] 1 beta subcomplex subunit 11, mitochondrial [Pseudophryne corroboree]|uniref:NADH dehydrogenase [ubiquinone] 1 beta subcomplex subunit 11, mitochondrial n=1 Tax=Pseudophryne corroboree TaxID=495146 RepID=UPI003081FFA4